MKQSKVSQIARRNYIKHKDIDESDDEDEENYGEDGYNIDPSAHMWKPVDFGRYSSKKNITTSTNSFKSNDSDSKLPSALTPNGKISPNKTSKRDNKDRKGELSATELPAIASMNLKPASESVMAAKKKSYHRLTHDPPVEDTTSTKVQAVESSAMSPSQSRAAELERERIAKERQELKRMLDAVNREKRELLKLNDEHERKVSVAAAEAEKTTSEVQNANAALAAEREEMKRMMDAIQREKKEIMHLTAKRAREKSMESELAAKEREDLRVMLETLRSQNEMLMNQMKTSEAAARMEIEEERKQRVSEVNAIEEKNKLLTQQVLEKQAEAERKLAQERDELKAALKRMEREKFDLSQKVYDTEARAKADAAAVSAQRKEYEEKLKAMEAEKQAVYRQVEENEAAAKMATEAVAGQLAKEKAELESKLVAMERDKEIMSTTLLEREQEAKRQAEELALRLAEEKKALLESSERMEAEKVELAKTLTEAEKQAKEQAKVVSEQLKKEKEELDATKLRMQREKEELEKKLAENEKQSAEASMAKSEELSEERQRLQQQLELMRREKEEMEARMKEAADQALEREKAANDRIAKERDELREAVERMKTEMEMERKRMEEERALEGKSESNSKSKLNLKPTSSLYDMMESQGEEPKKPQETRNNRSHAILTIAECEEEMRGGGSYDTEEVTFVSDPVSADPEVPSEDFGPGVEEVQEEGDDSEEEEDDFVDLPAPHAAAARGDLEKLRELARVEPSLLASFDSAGRSPLFYAVAYNNASATSYLIDVAPECVHQTDAHGDTPLHAAASSGSDACVSLLLGSMTESGCDGVDARNSMGMTPVHLAQNAAVLNLLYSAGANLTAVDKNDRSGLFVAAAMNRKDCVEYLLDCLDGDDDALYMMDSRGDTPLHAAACNGAEESLLLLLQCGISPLMTNKKGLKAIDLAQKNKKKKCREILAQYHLHFATTSDFDSVLFIAALEGHKKVQDMMMSALESQNDECYNIIKSTGASKEDQMREQAQKMFSLNNKKSLRLKKWGSWIAYEDQNSSSTYWYNHKTGGGQWNVPDSVAPLMTAKASFASHSSRSVLQISSKASMRLKRVGDWIQYSTESGQTFYYNDKNGDFQWVNPESEAAPEMMEQAAEEEWVPYKDPESGCIFWYNKKTNVSQWECPLAPGEGAEHLDNPDEFGHAYADEVVEVHSDADLGID